VLCVKHSTVIAIDSDIDSNWHCDSIGVRDIRKATVIECDHVLIPVRGFFHSLNKEM